MTGNVYITIIMFPGIDFGIALHSLYRILSAEIILLYIILTATLKLDLFHVFHHITFKFSRSKIILRYVALWLH